MGSFDSFNVRTDRSGDYAADKCDRFSVKTSTAFVLALLALAIAVGVGLIVHFAEGNKNVVCQCSCGDSSNSAGQGGCPEQTTPPPVTCAPCPTISVTSSSAPGISSTAPGITQTFPQTTALPPPSTPIAEDVLLPNDLSPKHYNVVLRPNLYDGSPSNFSLTGSVTITTLCVKSTRNITLHIQNLNVTSGSLNVTDRNASVNIEVADYRIDYSARHFLVIELQEELVAGKEYDIEMAFTGPLQNSDLSGLYYSTYTHGEETKYMAITQFQPTDARKAFPSFDEPALKATFDITLERRPENNMITLSNMPLIRNETSTDGYVADVFDTTVVMPTYLLAFAVCDFEHKANTTKNNHTFRTFARSEYIHHTNYSLWVGSMLLDEFEEYFGIMYPLPKLDMIAIPDFSAGAMENWGLVTYRESIMFYHPDISTASQHMFTALVVSHELAHMWFGNLISPEWWDDLWLNEGFATFFEYLGVDFVETDWKMMDFIAYDCVQYSFETDSLMSSRPIYQAVWTPNEINGIFDVITYFKGASVIRMMWFFLGPDVFRRGLSNYIKSREYGNVQHDDLWMALSKESEFNGTNINVTRIMDTWIEQKNYPVVNVTVTNGGIHLTQHRFLLGESSDESQRYLWEIPITYTTNKTANFQQDYRNITWMNTTELTISDDNIDDSSWIILNIQEFGYYRVNYPQNIWNAITRQLDTNHTVIHVVNRAAIISDAWALNKAGILDINSALHTIDYLDREKEYIPWASAIRELSYIDRMLVFKEVYGHFERFMVEKVRSTFMENRLNITQDQPVQQIFLQSSVASRACKYGIKECSDAATAIFNSWKNDPENYVILPDIKPTVLCTAIRHGTSDDWDFVFHRYGNSSANDQSIFTNAMSCSQESWILNRFLEYSLDDMKIRSQNTRSVILAVESNPIGRNLAWTFVRSKWDYLVKESGLESSTLNRLVTGLTRSFSTAYELKQVENWKAEHPAEADPLPGFDQAVETIGINMAWNENHYQILKQWLEENYSM